jgi:hypothetical protein
LRAADLSGARAEALATRFGITCAVVSPQLDYEATVGAAWR